MNIEEFREYCLSLPGATEIVQWEYDLLFKVGGKMFAATPVIPPHGVSFKATADTFAELIERPGVTPAPYLAKHNWVRCESYSTIPAREFKALIAESYRLVLEKLPKKMQAEIATLA